MPELPEVEIVRRGLEPVLTGTTITSLDLRRPDLRFPFPDNFASRLNGQRVVAVNRRAKYLLIALDNGETLIIHLGMTGRLSVAPADRPQAPITFGDYVYGSSADAKHDHVVMTLAGGTTITYNDPRRFGFMLLAHNAGLDHHPLLANIGPEPLGNSFDAHYLAAKAKDKRTGLKAFLLDQRIVAGLGNIYVSEALHAAGLSPKRRAGTLAGARKQALKRSEDLATAVRTVLSRAIAAGGSTLKDYRQTDGSSGGFQNEFAVYGRDGEPCCRCAGTILRLVQAQRATFYCPDCQN